MRATNKAELQYLELVMHDRYIDIDEVVFNQGRSLLQFPR